MKPASPVLEGYPVTEFTLGHGLGVPAHPVVRWTEEGVCLSRWTLSEEELAEVVRTREIFVLHASHERHFIPVQLQVERPEYALRCLRVSGSEVFHGMEVVRAGGSEADRVDFAAAEASAYLASIAGLPCQVELLRPDAPARLEGGETCATRPTLEEALAKRLKKALDLGERCVEARSGSARESVLRAEVVELTRREIEEKASVPGDSLPIFSPARVALEEIDV